MNRWLSRFLPDQTKSHGSLNKLVCIFFYYSVPKRMMEYLHHHHRKWRCRSSPMAEGPGFVLY